MLLIQIFLTTIIAVYSVNTRITGRIYKGTDVTNMKEVPYQAGLSCGNHWCGGSILSKHWILTAAHCLRSCGDGNVYMGDIYRGEYEFLYNGVTIAVSKNDYIINENYDAFTHDIALIKLPKAIKFTEKIQPIKLIPKELSNENQFDGKIVDVSGWGAINNINPGYYTKLQLAKIKVTSNKNCSEDFGEEYIKSEHICTTGEEAKGICAGDSGGPMAVRVNGERYLLGVAAFISGYGCEAARPRAFTRVSAYRDWISEKTKNEIK